MPKATSKTRHLQNPRQDGPRREQPVKRWCFTLNNPTAEERRHIQQIITADSVDFAVIGNEIGDSGTPHLQGFLNMKTKRRLGTMKKWFNARAQYEAAKGTDLQNDEYCTKGGDTYLRIGEPGKERCRNDLQKAIDVVKRSSGSMRAVAEACPATFIRYGRGLRDYANVMQYRKPRDFKTEVKVYVGDPGCSKSRKASELCAGTTVYYKPRGMWWDGYDGQENVIVDDFYGWMPCDELLRVFDRYPCKVPVKGAYVEFVSTAIYVTSNKHVWQWYKFEGFDPAAVMRRVNVYLVYDNAGERFVNLRESAMYDPVTMRYCY
ncbi:replication associated protein [Barbel circovirus]|uniref:Replication associated protein n=1 Tax=Barbel circovirus TaxID=759938 RepID=F5BSB4_9CIRC|nr:replication associated protein [Barbel circovirus]